MVRFKTQEEFEEFCDKSWICVCNKLMTGMHMTYCKQLRKMRERLENKSLNQIIKNG